jgi:hypothetical protein
MPDNLAAPQLNKHGGKRPGAGRPKKGETRKKNQRFDVTSKPTRGHSVNYIIARLQRDGLTKWIEAIHQGKLSAFAVACELGWAKRPTNLGTGSQNAARKRAWDIRAMIG